jgi:hypothetical protein
MPLLQFQTLNKATRLVVTPCRMNGIVMLHVRSKLTICDRVRADFLCKA